MLLILISTGTCDFEAAAFPPAPLACGRGQEVVNGRSDLEGGGVMQVVSLCLAVSRTSRHGLPPGSFG